MKFKSTHSILIPPMVLLFLCTGCGFNCGPPDPIMQELPPNLKAYLDDALFDYDTWLFTSDAGDTMLLKRETAYEVDIQKHYATDCRDVEFTGGSYIGTASYSLKYNQDSTKEVSTMDTLGLRIYNNNPQSSPISISFFLARFKWSNRSDSLLSDPSEVYDNYAIRDSFSLNNTLYHDVLVPTDSLPQYQLIISREDGLIAVFSSDGKRMLNLEMKN